MCRQRRTTGERQHGTGRISQYDGPTGEGVPVGIPEEIKLSAGAPFAPTGTGTMGVGYDEPEPEPVIPVPDIKGEPADNDKLPVAPALDAAEFVVGGPADAADAI